ncbi:MAG: replicative DNA helicase [Planctomycetota bacterium]|jgi:replicative DNA helicase
MPKTKDPLLHKLPPQNIEAEESLLSAILIDNGVLDHVTEILSPDDFYKSAHQKIFSAIIELYKNNEPVDLVTLTNKLREKSYLEKIGGAIYLAKLLDSVPMAVNAKHYAGIIHEKFLIRRLIEKGNRIIDCCLEDRRNVDEIIDFAERSIFEISQNKSKAAFRHAGATLKKNMDMITELNESKGLPTGVPTGFTDSESRIGLSRIRYSFLTKDDWEIIHRAAGRLSEAPIYIDDSPDLSVMEIRSKVRRLKSQHGIHFVIIDYLQLMRVRSTAERRDIAIAEISRGLKILAKELEIPIMALSQLNRMPEQRKDKRPILSDLRESGAIEQDADIVAFLHRDEAYNSGVKGTAEIILAKHRNGPTGVAHLFFLDECTRFENAENRY